MTDIAERLRDPRRIPTMTMRMEAADEIEQLHMKIRTLRQDNGAVIVQLQNDIREARSEIERLQELLRAARGILQHHQVIYPDEIDELLKESKT